MRRVGFATFVGAESTFWGLISRRRSESDEFDEDLGCGFESGTLSDELEEHSFLLLRQKFDVVMSSAIGGQDVDEGLGWDDWFSFVVHVGAGVICDQVVEVALDVGYREPVPAIDWHSCRKTEGCVWSWWWWLEGKVREGSSGRGVLKGRQVVVSHLRRSTRLPETANKAQESHNVHPPVRRLTTFGSPNSPAATVANIGRGTSSPIPGSKFGSIPG